MCVCVYVYVCAAVPNRTPRGLVWRLRLTLPSALQCELLLALKNVMHDGRRSAARVNTKLLACWIKDKKKWMDVFAPWLYVLFLFYYSCFQSVRIQNVSVMIGLQKIHFYSFFSFFDLRVRSSKKSSRWKNGRRRRQRSKGVRDHTGGCRPGLERVKGGGGD